MKLFLDTADVKEVKKRLSTGLISGITTNPTLIFKSGEHPQDVYWELIKLAITDVGPGIGMIFMKALNYI